MLLSYALLGLVGVEDLISRLTVKWQLPYYWAIFMSLLSVSSCSYFFLITHSRFLLGLAAGAGGGVAAGLLATLISGWFQFGLGSYIRGVETGGTGYIAVVLVTPIFPFCSWLYGAVAFAFGHLVGRCTFLGEKSYASDDDHAECQGGRHT